MTGPRRRSTPAGAPHLSSLPVLAAALAAGSCTIFHQDLPNVPPVVQLDGSRHHPGQAGRPGLPAGGRLRRGRRPPHLPVAGRGRELHRLHGQRHRLDRAGGIEGSSEVFLITVVIRDGDPDDRGCEGELRDRGGAAAPDPAVGSGEPHDRRPGHGGPGRPGRRRGRRRSHLPVAVPRSRGLGPVPPGPHHQTRRERSWPRSPPSASGMPTTKGERRASSRCARRRRGTRPACEFISLAEARHEIEIAVTDTVDTVSARFVIRATRNP